MNSDDAGAAGAPQASSRCTRTTKHAMVPGHRPGTSSESVNRLHGPAHPEQDRRSLILLIFIVDHLVVVSQQIHQLDVLMEER